METVYRHVVLRDEGRHLELVARHDGVQVLDAGQTVDLGFYRRRHERREPPRHHLSPERRMNNVESFQILLVFVRQHRVHLLEPREGRMVRRRGQRVEVRDHVVTAHDRIQEFDQV